MRKSKGKRPKLPVACVAAALLVAGFSLLSSLARGVGVVEPHVWVETAPADGKSIERQSRYRAVGTVMDGEVARTAERLREAQALAAAAGLFVVTERGSGRATRGVGDLVAGLSARKLLPPGLTVGRQEGTLLSSHGTLFVRYRPSPLGVEVVALGLVTGMRREEVISLRGKDLEFKDETLIIKYRRKGGKFTAREISDPSAHKALAAYLEASGRGNVLGSERPLWTRHDRAGRPGAPLSSRAFVENLKGYAKEAGLSHVHLHQTRHTYARIVAEETGSFLEAQEALDHENQATTRVYVQRITVKRDRHGRMVGDRIRIRRGEGTD